MAAHQASPSLGFSRQEYWSGLPFPSPMRESEKWKWSHSVVSNSVRPHRWQPTRLPCPWDSPGKSTGVGFPFLLQCMKGKSLSRARLLATPWTAANQVPPSMRFSRQEYCRGLPLPSPITILRGRDYILIMSICISLMMYEADHLFVYMFVICTFFYCFLAY